MLIVFETHATSLDNEAGLASGWFDVDLSPAGEQQARALGVRRADDELTVVYCSDLRRAVRTAEIAFEVRDVAVLQDPRLRECDYGEWTRWPAAEIEAARAERLSTPFPGGESYEQVAQRVGAWLDEMISTYRRYSDRLLVIGHRATFYALEHRLRQRPLRDVITAPWHWQPGWSYRLD